MKVFLRILKYSLSLEVLASMFAPLGGGNGGVFVVKSEINSAR